MGYDQQATTTKQTNTAGLVLMAAAAGAVAGVLLAPKKGTDTRAELKGKYNDVKNKTQDKAHTAKSKLDAGVEAARSKVHSAADKTKDVADKAADKAHDATSNVPGDTTLADEIRAEHAKRGRSTL